MEDGHRHRHGVRAHAARRRRKFFLSPRSAWAIGFWLLCAFSLNAFAIGVTPLFSFGDIDGDAAPKSAAVFRDALFLSAGDTLYQLDTVRGAPRAMPLPPALGHGLQLDAQFANFDGALFMHARRRHGAGNGLFLHRIANLSGRIELVDVPEEPDTPAFAWVTDRGYADDTRGFAEFDGHLYFFAARAIPNLSGHRRSHALYRLRRANARPERVLWEDYFNTVRPRDLAASSLGIVFRTQSPGVARHDVLPQAYVYRIEDPISIAQASVVIPDFAVASAKRISPHSASRELIVFDQKLFFAGEHHAYKIAAEATAGPIPDPGRVKDKKDPWQSELYFHDPNTGNWYFDLYSITPQEAEAAAANGDSMIGSANPHRFVTSAENFYFRARTSANRYSLMRLGRGEITPSRLDLNDFGDANARPLASFRGHLIVAADAGDGYDLHLMNELTNLATPLYVGASVAQSARAFVEFDNHVVFSAEVEDGTWWSHAINLAPLGGDPERTALRTTLYLNGTSADTTTATVVESGDLLTLGCRVNNTTHRDIDNVRAVVRLVNPYLKKKRSEKPGDGEKGEDTDRFNRGLANAGKSVCRKDTLGSQKTIRCDMVVRMPPGEHKFDCIGSITDGVSTRHRSQARATVFARRSNSNKK